MSLPVSLAREIAFDAYVQVMDHGTLTDDALEAQYQAHADRLKRLDRNFIKELLFGSLRWHSKIFWILQNTATRDLSKTTPEIRAALVMGTYQIFYMDKVPDRAAVNESVEYVRKKGQNHASSFINGILRQIARRSAYFPKPDKETKPVEYLSIQFAHPNWIVERWFRHFRFDRMELILAANNKAPPHSVRINTMKTATENINALQQMLLKDERTHSERRPLRCSLQLRESPKLDHESLFAQGFYTIQDEAAQLVSFLVAPQEGEKIADVCCGPGGKLGHIFELSEGKALLWGLDSNPAQISKAQATMERLGHSGIQLDAGNFLEWQIPDGVTKILIDAPCSGLGVLRRHPEGKWQKSPKTIDNMVEIQRKFLTHALKILPIEGECIYAVCSFEPEETTEQLDWLQNEFKDKIEVVSTVSRLPDYYKRYVTRENVFLVYSGNQNEMDGFGAFVVKKKKTI